jgi:hypothetical protein
VKHERVINQGKSLDDLVTQVRHAFAKPFKRTDSPEDCHVSAVITRCYGNLPRGNLSRATVRISFSTFTKWASRASLESFDSRPFAHCFHSST